MARTGRRRFGAQPRPGVIGERRAPLRRELRALISLAAPVALAEVGWMSMGRVGAVALGAVSVGSHLYFAVAIFGLGLLLGLDTIVSQARGGGRMDEAHGALVQGLYLALALALGLGALLWALASRLDLLGVDPALVPEARAYTRVVTASLLPHLLYAALRRYLQALERVRFITAAVLVANLANALVDWVLVFGHLGAPALGAVGSAWATVASRSLLFLALAGHVLWRAGAERTGLRLSSRRLDRPLLRRLATLGLPAAAQTALEVGVFTAATLLAARLDPVSLAAHQVALQTAALTFMVPLGISAAGAVRVGSALGRGDHAGARRSGLAALLLGGGFMAASALALLSWPWWIARAFTTAPAILAAAAGLLRIAAVFQLFDGLQVVATGVLRGAGDTRTPMITSLVCFWLIALPVGWILCFRFGAGVRGLWVGLCLGLVLVALALVTVWARRLR